MDLKDGQPCNHVGFLNHISHPCEGCGRIAGIKIIGIDGISEDKAYFVKDGKVVLTVENLGVKH